MNNLKKLMQENNKILETTKKLDNGLAEYNAQYKQSKDKLYKTVDKV